MHLPDALTPLRDRRFAWYYAGRVISIGGSTMAPVALAFAVLDLTSNSASALGMVLAANSIPLVIFLLVGGVIADRFSRSLVLQVSHLASALTQGTVAALLLTGTAQLWMVIVLEAVNGTVRAFTFPAMGGVVPLVVPRTHLQQANAMLSFSRGGLTVIGPSVAGILVATVGSGWALGFDSLTWLIAAGCMSRIGLPPRDRAESANMILELREGWSAFRQYTWLWLIVVVAALQNAIFSGAFLVVALPVAKRTIGPGGWGLVLSAQSLGTILATVVLLKLRLRYPLRAGELGVACMGLPIVLVGTNPQLWPLALAAFLAGAGLETFSIGWDTALQENIDERVLSRVSSYDALGSFVAIPIGQLTFGPLGTALGAETVLVVSGCALVVLSLGTLASRSVRDLQRAPVAEPVG